MGDIKTFFLDRLSFFKFKDIYIFLFIFTFIYSKPAGTILATFILIYWFFKVDRYDKIKSFFSNDLIVLFLFYFLYLIIGLLWSQNIQEGSDVIRKHRWFLYFPAFVWFFRGYREKIIKYYTFSIVFLVSLSYLLYFRIWIPGINRDFTFFCPVHHHVSHGILVSLGLFFLLRSIRYKKSISVKLAYYILSILLIYNTLFTQGRMGQIIMLITIFFHVLNFYRKTFFRGFLISVLVLGVIFSLSFEFNQHFSSRINAAISDFKIALSDDDFFYKIGNGRMGMWEASWKVFEGNPLLGTGTGDFPEEYLENFPEKYKKNYIYYGFIKKYSNNPHNYFILILARNGLIGFLLFLSIFWILFKNGYTLRKKDLLFLYIPTVFLLMNLTDVYFQKHNYQGLFIIFSALIYRKKIFIKKKPSILHCEMLKNPGGQLNRVLTDILITQENGYDCYLAAPADSWIYINSRMNGVKTFKIPFKNVVFDLFSIIKLLKKIAYYDIDIIASHSGKESYISCFTAKILGKKYVRYRHMPLKRGYSLTYSLADNLIVTGDVVKEQLKSMNIDEKKIFSIPSFYFSDEYMDLNIYNKEYLLKKFDIEENSLVFGSLCGYVENKRPEWIVDAALDICRKYHNVVFLVAGNGNIEIKKKLQEKIKNEKLGKQIKLFDYLKRPELLFSIIDVYLLSSLSEGVPQTILQAMVFGKAVITTDAGSVSTLNLEENLIIVDKKDFNNWKKNIEDFIKNRERIKALGIKNKNISETFFNNKIYIKKLMNIFNGLLNEK